MFHRHGPSARLVLTVIGQVGSPGVSTSLSRFSSRGRRDEHGARHYLGSFPECEIEEPG